ncbi:TetR/AcrR family transcriptional regulator [Bauldia litoralis]|uniref:Transcriptional regulator, TetR family n=1 Tax=Bauldia litoralis TaxID=665467 RepID=A0A1G6EAC1_9HYPH|nr:TetR/AcrR family transcriptional regulator [Bauldia litoralis]SDB54292.1 transcriptional regulator, TetR family [Bauldia litoralis]
MKPQETIDRRYLPRVVAKRPVEARKHDAERTRQDILAAAMNEFAEHGDTGARIDRIAENARCNKALIYAYFGNKEDLFAVVLREAYIQIREGEKRLDLDALSPKEAIVRLLRFTAKHFHDNPWFIRLLNTENQRGGRTIRKMNGLNELNSPLVRMLGEVLKRGQAEGVLRSDVDPLHLYLSIAGLFYFPLSNSFTLSAIFDQDIDSDRWLEERMKCAEEMVIAYLSVERKS